MKLLITVVTALLAVTLGASPAQAKDKHKKHSKHHHDDHGRDYRYQSSQRSTYSRVYGSQPYYYSGGRRYYSYERDPAYGNRYYYPRPSISLQFGR